MGAMLLRARASLAALGIGLALALSSGVSLAGDTSVAEQLFSEGLKAMERKDYKAACEAFAGSNEADPSPGTLINLALCHEKQGMLASAWGEYRTAAGLAEQRKQPERVELARAAAAKLEPQLHKIVLVVNGAPADLTVTRDGKPVPSATFNREIPIDPGEHVLEATAKGKKPFKRTIAIASNAQVDRVTIALEDEGAIAPPALGTTTTEPPKDAPSGSDGTTQRNVGYLVGAGGIIALGVAGGLQLLALSVDRDRKSLESDLSGNQCSPTVAGKPSCEELSRSVESKRDAASGNQLAAIITGAGGVLMLGAGIVLVLTAPSRKTGSPLVVPVVQPGYAGLATAATF